MEKKSFLLLFLVVAIVFSLVVFFFLLKGAGLSPAELEECNTLKFNGDDKTSVVFFSDKKTSERYANSLLSFSPFSGNKEQFNFYYIDYEPSCELYKGIALLCYSKDLIKKAGSCPNDYIVVVEEESGNIRSSSYMNVISLNSRQSLNVLPHEFGHAFASLSDEYVPAKVPRGAKNCISNCDSFGELGEGCFEGCGEEEYFRSIESGIMRTLNSNKYGEFNENIILGRLGVSSGGSVAGMAVGDFESCSDEKYYLIDLYYDENGEISVVDKKMELGCVGSNGYGDFELQIVLEDGRILDGGEFNPELIFTDANEGGDVYIYAGEFVLKVPAIEGAKSLEINDGKGGEVQVSLLGMDARPCKL